MRKWKPSLNPSQLNKNNENLKLKAYLLTTVHCGLS